MKTQLFTVLVLVASCSPQLSAQNKQSLPRSTPEEQGISSTAISAFLDSIAKSKHEFQSFMLVRHGKVIAEGWWNPYRADLRHTLYSLSKSFTATAVGFARAEGKIALTDKVISFFPDKLPDSVSTYLKQLNVKDLLTMSVGQEPDPTFNTVQTKDWIKTFLATPIKYEPGSRFLYNSMATYMLSAIVQKATGQKVIDYLQPRMFEPLGISGVDWETDLDGINTGGWGLRVKTEDIAKFAQLFLQKGKWNGKQVLPPGWAEEASSTHIIQHPQYSQAKRDSSDWEQGYGYQMWRCRHNGFRGDGAFGQYAIVLPEQDAVIAITSETNDMQGEQNLIWKILLPAFKDGALKSNKAGNELLSKKLASLSMPVKKESINVKSSMLAGKTFNIEPNSLDIQSLTFANAGDNYNVKINTSAEVYDFKLAPNSWATGETTLPGPYLLGPATNNLKGLPPFKVAGEYTWLDGNTLELVLRYTESPHTRTILCKFDGDNISVVVTRSVLPDMEGGTVTLKGKTGEEPFDHEKYNPGYTLAMPEKWGVERFAIPIEFAPVIPYSGVEDVRFAPGWSDPKSNDYWSYAFLWFLNGKPGITPEATEKNLTAYYTGLIERNIEPRKIPKEKLIPVKVSMKKTTTDPGDVQTFSGTVDMLDYMQQKPITFNCIVHIKLCPGKNNTFVFTEISPRPLTNEIWKGLKNLWTTFDCSQPK